MARILIVEDNASWFELLRKPIAVKTNTIEYACSLDEAKSQLQTQEYDVVITDLKLTMRQKDLLESFGTLVSSLGDQDTQPHHQVPFIVVTAYEVDRSELIKTLNVYPGRIWGWHEKASIDFESYRLSVQTALEVQSKKTSSPSRYMRHLVTVVGSVAVIIGIAWIFAGTSIGIQQQPLFLSTAILAVILGLSSVILVNYGTISAKLTKGGRENGTSAFYRR